MADICDTPPRNKLVEERNEAMNNNKDVNWISLIGHNQIEAENEEKLYSKLNTQCNARFRSDLDGQIAIKKGQRKSSEDEVKAYRAALNQQFSSYRSEDDRKVAVKHAEMLKLKAVREQQVEEAKLKRKYDELKKKKHELRAVEKLKRELATERGRRPRRRRRTWPSSRTCSSTTSGRRPSRRATE
jgi:hypothetical protein